MLDAQQRETVTELLRRTKVEVAPATFFLVGMREEDWSRLLEQPELSPRPTVPFMLLRDGFEVTLLLEEEDWLVMRHALREARVETGWRLVTLDIELGWNVTGFLARVTEILARRDSPRRAHGLLARSPAHKTGRSRARTQGARRARRGTLLRVLASSELAGKDVLITGASSGIGEALAVEFGRRGASVGLLARRAEFCARWRGKLRPRAGALWPSRLTCATRGK
jgi:hypothetical protein